MIASKTPRVFRRKGQGFFCLSSSWDTPRVQGGEEERSCQSQGPSVLSPPYPREEFKPGTTTHILFAP